METSIISDTYSFQQMYILVNFNLIYIGIQPSLELKGDKKKIKLKFFKLSRFELSLLDCNIMTYAAQRVYTRICFVPLSCILIVLYQYHALMHRCTYYFEIFPDRELVSSKFFSAENHEFVFKTTI